MDIRTYEARTMADALERIQQDLGPRAVILHAREQSHSRWLGLRRQSCIQVTAGVGVPCAGDSDEAIDPTRSLIEGLNSRIEGLATLVGDICRRKVSAAPELPPALRPVFNALLDAGVDESLASDLACGLRDRCTPNEMAEPARLQERLCSALQEELRTAGVIECSEGNCRVVALVGPTGAGKTTCIAKLAAHFKLRQMRKVGLVTVDTYRIAAVEQLRVYAEIIDLPMRVAMTPREMAAAVEDMRHLDLVLIDSVGRSPVDQLRLKELRSLLAEARAHEVHLVLSAVAAPAALQSALDAFAPLDVSRVVLTKLDEATSLGGALSVLARGSLPLSYVTAGQNVPDDIEVADSAALARRVLGEIGGLCRGDVRRAA